MLSADLLTGIEMQRLSLVYLHLTVASKILKSRKYNASPECYGSTLVTSGKDILGLHSPSYLYYNSPCC